MSALSDSTSFIRVSTINRQIYDGIEWMFYVIFIEHVYQRYKPTASTTIEEYEIIRYIGRTLGEKGMPKVNYPPELTQWEIETNLIQTFPTNIHKKKMKKGIQESLEWEKKNIDWVLGEDE